MNIKIYIKRVRNLTSVEELKDWCYANVGNIGSWIHHKETKFGITTGWTFCFNNPEDAVAFKLKFGL